MLVCRGERYFEHSYHRNIITAPEVQFPQPCLHGRRETPEARFFVSRNQRLNIWDMWSPVRYG